MLQHAAMRQCRRYAGQHRSRRGRVAGDARADLVWPCGWCGERGWRVAGIGGMISAVCRPRGVPRRGVADATGPEQPRHSRHSRILGRQRILLRCPRGAFEGGVVSAADGKKKDTSVVCGCMRVHYAPFSETFCVQAVLRQVFYRVSGNHPEYTRNAPTPSLRLLRTAPGKAIVIGDRQRGQTQEGHTPGESAAGCCSVSVAEEALGSVSGSSSRSARPRVLAGVFSAGRRRGSCPA
jgi:hypothetical protein